MEAFVTRTRIVTIDQDGVEIPGQGEGEDRGREYINTPLSILYPDVPVVIIDWMADGAQPTPTQIKEPISYLDQEWTGWRAWGSAIKKGATTGLPVEMADELTKLQRKCRDAPRWNRAYLAQGIFGAGHGDIRAKILKMGTVKGGHMVHDGFGLIRRSVAEEIHTGASKITLRQPWDSWQFSQRIPWTDAVAKEVTRELDTLRELLVEPDTFAFHGSNHIKAVAEWVELEPELAKHPRTAKALTRSRGGLLFSAATSIPTQSKTWIAVPARQVTVTSESALYCYPIDSWDCIRVVPKCTDEEEVGRVKNLEVVQYTLTNDKASAKGLLGVVDDDIFEDDVDMYVTTEDFKMKAWGWGGVNKGNRKFTFTNTVLVFTQWYAAGHALGTDPKTWKTMGRDWDGDYGFTFPVAHLPAVAAEIRMFPRQSVGKLKKDNLPIIEKGRILPKMAVRGMENVIGLATNLMGHSFMVADRNEMAHVMGFPNVAAMDNKLSTNVKIGSDQYKTWLLWEVQKGRKDKLVSIDELESRMGGVQSKVQFYYGCVASWTRWRRSTSAFEHMIPKVLGQEAATIWAQEGGVLTEMLREQILPRHTGTVAQIARYMLPDIEKLLNIHDEIFAWPLSRFASWAMIVPPAIYKVARELQLWWIGHTRGVNWTDGDEVHKFYAMWEAEVQQVMEEKDIDRWTMANALWRAAHTDRSSRSTGASVFCALVDEMKRIVVEKPGLEQQYHPEQVYVGVGLHLNVKDMPNTFSGVGTIIEREVTIRGKRVIRPMLVGVPGLEMTEKSAHLPGDLVMMFDLKKAQPPLGTHRIHWERMGSYKAWRVWLLGPGTEQHDQP